MLHEVLMPKLSSTMTHGSVTEWYKKEGDPVKVGERIFEVMTDKIAIEVESYDEGILLKRYVEVNDSVPCNSIIAYIGEPGDIAPDVAPSLEEHEETDEVVVATPVATVAAEEPTQRITTTEIPRSTPAARKLAKENGIDLSVIKGSGRNGRIHLIDVQEHKPTVHTTETISKNDVVIPWSGMRKAVADAMTKSVQNIPHVTMNASANIDGLLALRAKLLSATTEEDSRISIADLFVMIVSKVLKRHPLLNATTSDQGIHLKESINMGLAVAIDQGLIVPVIKNADTLGLSQIATQSKELASLARSGQLNGEQLRGGTFTITSIGKGAVTTFTPIINYPEVAILGIGSSYKALKLIDGITVEETRIDFSLSFDHRAVDGYPTSLFLNDLVAFTENTDLLLL